MTDRSTVHTAPTTPILAAWALCLLALGLAAAAFAIRVPGTLATGVFIDPEQVAGDVVWLLIAPLAAPTYAAVGAVLATQRPGNTVGWLCLALALAVVAQDLIWQLNTYAGDLLAPLAPPRPGPAAAALSRWNASLTALPACRAAGVGRGAADHHRPRPGRKG